MFLPFQQNLHFLIKGKDLEGMPWTEGLPKWQTVVRRPPESSQTGHGGIVAGGWKGSVTWDLGMASAPLRQLCWPIWTSVLLPNGVTRVDMRC